MTIRAILLVVMSVGWWRVSAAAGNVRIPGATSKRAAVTVVLLAAVLALGSGPVLNLLDVDTETFRVATGLALIGLGLARILGWGLAAENPAELKSGWLWPVTYPVLVGPELVLVAVSLGSDHGVALVTLAAGAGLVLAALAARLPQHRESVRMRAAAAIYNLCVRGAGVVLVVLAVALIFDGLRDV